MHSASDPRGLVLAALAAASLGLDANASSTAVEYYQAAYGHYFVTASQQEIGSLDAGVPAGWSRTGESFAVLDVGTPGAANVCRFWTGQRYAPKSSHFYTSVPVECASVKVNPDWRYEGEVFAMQLPLSDGSCAAGTKPLYRLYNDGQGGAPNHRYTTSTAVRAQMLAQGWRAEGAGVGVIGCVPTSLGAVSVVAAGDIAQCRRAPASESGAARTAALIRPQDDVVLTLGDNAYENGTPDEFATCFDPTWGAFKDRIRPAPGNHDYYYPEAAGYYDYFGAQTGPDRRGYYSFDLGGWHFVALNTMVDRGPGSPQYRWLQTDLAQSAAQCTIAYWHHPLFNSGGVYGPIREMQPLFDVLYAAGVEMVLSGHEHIYERFAPQRGDGVLDPARGVRQFVVGTGGHELNPLGPPIPNSEFRQNTHWGVLRLTLSPGRYAWQFVAADGGTPLDSGSATCH